MKDMEREKFEQSWKDAFDKAEVSPSETVWTNIELDLEKAKGGELKRRLLFYKMLAAASVLFAMMIGGAGVYLNFNDQKYIAASDSITERSLSERSQSSNNNSEDANPSDRGVKTPPLDIDVTEEGQTAVAENSSAAPLDSGNANNRRESTKRNGSNNEGLATLSENEGGSNGSTTLWQRLAMSEEVNSRALPALPHELDERPLPSLYEPRQIVLILPSASKQEVDPVVAMLARLEQREKEIRGEQKNEKEDESHENLWTSVGFAAGSFNSIAAASPSRPGPTTMSSAMTAPIVDQETKASGYSYSMGVNIGTKISERWVFQGGVNYLTHATEYTANNVLLSSPASPQRFHAAATNELIKSNELDLSNKIVYSAPYSVNNNMSYISIPMQAGYLLIDKTFGLQLNAGVSTDLFLQNTIEANSDQIDKTSQGSGADSPYRTVNLSGLFGTELSYRFNENYRVSLNPGVRYPFNTIYKSELGVQSTPFVFDIGLRFRYIFH